MSFDVEQHVLYRIANAPLQRFPFPHFYVQNVFPEDFYRELLARLPADSAYGRLDEGGTVPKGAYPDRFILALESLEEEEAASSGDFWTSLSSWLLGDGFAGALLRKFQPAVEERFGRDTFLRISTECRMVRDHTNYSISPHTDKPTKLVSLLFYLPADDSIRDLGTSIYTPIDPTFRCDGTAHHEFSRFRQAARMDFAPNSLFGFFKTDRAFHGVEPIRRAAVVRNAMLYNIYVKKAVARPRKSFIRWPWHKKAAAATTS